MAKGGAIVIGYTAVGDFLLPNIAYECDETLHLGCYSRLRQKFLKENHGGIYSEMLLGGSLWEHLAKVEVYCQARLERIVSALAESESVTESPSPLKRHIHSGRLAAHRQSESNHFAVVFNISYILYRAFAYQLLT